MSTSVLWITSKLMQTTRINSDRASHLVFDKFFRFSRLSTSFDASSSDLSLKVNNSFKTLHNLAQNFVSSVSFQIKSIVKQILFVLLANRNYNASRTTNISLIKSVDAHPCFTDVLLILFFDDLSRACSVRFYQQSSPNSVAPRYICLIQSL